MDGVNGIDGKDGINGTNGKDGKDGRNGRDGKDYTRKRNWKECAWDKIQDNSDYGVIKVNFFIFT